MLLHQQLPTVLALVQAVAEIAHQLESRDSTLGYHPGFYNFNGRGRPRINLTRPILEYFINNGFTGPQIASILHVSLSTVRRRMSAFGLSINSRYSSISDSQLDALMQDIQEQFPNCGYRMMIGHL